MISGVPAGELDFVWDEVEPYIQSALDKTNINNCYDTEHIYKGIQEKDYQLWVAYSDGFDAAFITEITKYPKCKILSIPFVGGRNIDSWIELAWENFKAFAKEHGCLAVRGMGRGGWTRKIKDKKDIHYMWDHYLED